MALNPSLAQAKERLQEVVALRAALKELKRIKAVAARTADVSQDRTGGTSSPSDHDKKALAAQTR